MEKSKPWHEMPWYCWMSPPDEQFRVITCNLGRFHALVRIELTGGQLEQSHVVAACSSSRLSKQLSAS